MADSNDEQRSDARTVDLRSRLDELIDDYRASLHDSLEGLSEAESRLRLVSSKTTLLGLVKHVEGVWFDQAVSGRSYADIGIPTTPDLHADQTGHDRLGPGCPSPAVCGVPAHDGDAQPERIRRWSWAPSGVGSAVTGVA